MERSKFNQCMIELINFIITWLIVINIALFCNFPLADSYLPAVKRY